MPDYFDAVEELIRAAQRQDPGVVLPWSWWQEQAERHGMSPNAVYTRAVKVGLYVPPNKRDNGAASPPPATPPPPKPEPVRPERAAQPARGEAPSAGTASASNADATPPSTLSAAPPDSPATGKRQNGHGAVASPPPVSLGNLSEAIHGFASLMERAALLEQQVGDLKRALEESQAENRRLRQSLHKMEDLAESMMQVYRTAILKSETGEGR